MPKTYVQNSSVGLRDFVLGERVQMIEQTYGHKMGDLGDRWRAALDASDQTFGHLSDTGE